MSGTARAEEVPAADPSVPGPLEPSEAEDVGDGGAAARSEEGAGEIIGRGSDRWFVLAFLVMAFAFVVAWYAGVVWLITRII